MLVTVLLAASATTTLARGADELESLIDTLPALPRLPLPLAFEADDFAFLPLNEAALLEAPEGRPDTPDETKARRAVLALIHHGADAVPHLLAHIEDDRPLGGPPILRVTFEDLYDFNRHGLRPPPFGASLGQTSPVAAADSYRPTVGDACFEILGQIVNRRFVLNPSPSRFICSPSRCPKLRVQLKAEWGGLTRDGLRRSLLEDFRHPDDNERQTGAYARLCHAFPETVEAAVLDALRQPFYDYDAIENFCREQLYRDGDVGEQRRALDQFVDEHGPAWAEGIQDRLHQDLERLEYVERSSHPDELPSFGHHPRRLLVELFHAPRDIRAARPVRQFQSDYDRASLISRLTLETSPAIGDAVLDVLRRHPRHPALVPASLRCLAPRGYADVLIAQIDGIDSRRPIVNRLDMSRLYAIAISKTPAVRACLMTFLDETTNPRYLLAVADTTDKGEEGRVLAGAQRILRALPEDTDDGWGLLWLIGERQPDRAAAVAADFLRCRHPNRIDTVCRACRIEGPPLEEALLPFLDDERRLAEDDPLTVAEEVAKALGRRHPEIGYDVDWPVEAKRQAMEKLKALHSRPERPKTGTGS